MVRLPQRPVLSWKKIAEIARKFSEEHSLADREYPLDVEEIAECDLGIEIRLASGVLEEFGSPAQIALGDERPVITVDAKARPSTGIPWPMKSGITSCTATGLPRCGNW